MNRANIKIVFLHNCVDVRLSPQHSYVFCWVHIVYIYIFAVLTYSVAKYPTNIGLNEVTAMQVPDERIPSIQRGSKIAHFSWTMYICMIFSFKGVMLTLFRKVGYVMCPEAFIL